MNCVSLLHYQVNLDSHHIRAICCIPRSSALSFSARVRFSRLVLAKRLWLTPLLCLLARSELPGERAALLVAPLLRIRSTSPAHIDTRRRRRTLVQKASQRASQATQPPRSHTPHATRALQHQPLQCRITVAEAAVEAAAETTRMVAHTRATASREEQAPRGADGSSTVRMGLPVLLFAPPVARSSSLLPLLLVSHSMVALCVRSLL